jgi:hypothetical protein
MMPISAAGLWGFPKRERLLDVVEREAEFLSSLNELHSPHRVFRTPSIIRGAPRTYHSAAVSR